MSYRRSYDILCRQSDKQRWLELHNTGIGASEIAAVLGEHPYQSNLRVWGEKATLLQARDLSDREPVYWGLVLEPVVAREFKKRTGLPVRKAGQLFRSRLHPWAITTLDYWTQGPDGRWNIPVQVKTTASWMLDYWTEGAPGFVQTQVQHEMLVTGAPYAHVVVLAGGQRFLRDEIKRDEAKLAQIVKGGGEFWELVQRGEAPIADSSNETAKAIKALWPKARIGAEKVLREEANEWDYQLVQAKENKSLYEKLVKELENKLKADIGDAQVGILPNGKGAYTYLNRTRRGYEVQPTEFRVLDRV
ncbi:MAG: YqaJ viral recombinase family protein [Dehalococcoidia bacterium]|nr:YqaJ viral recombinase family protein [Dehalococcoidia bacterium]